MKLKNTIITGSVVLMLAVCSCNTETVDNKQVNEVSVAQETVEVIDQPAETADVAGKVVHMNTAMFMDQIFDYKANPTTWIYKGDKPAIIDFYADWCGPCKRVAPIMDELALEYAGQINIYKIDTDKEKELAGQVFGIRSIPSILYIPVGGQPTMYTGAFPKERYVELINENLIKK